MLMITIYGLQSPYVYRVRACLLQKGLKFQHVSVNLGSRSEEFKKLSAVGTIPVMKDDDGTVVCDSFHIALYLDEKYLHTHKMLGNSLKEKAAIFNVLAVIDKANHINGPLSMEKYGYADRLRQGQMAHRALLYDEQQKHDAKADLARRLSTLEQLRGGREFFTSTFSFADAAMVSFLRSVEFGGSEIGSWKEWKDDLFKDPKIALMVTPSDELGVREI